MIFKSYQTKNINIDKNPFILLYGRNEGLKNQTKINLLLDRKIVSNYEENEIINNPDNFLKKSIQNHFLKMNK